MEKTLIGVTLLKLKEASLKTLIKKKTRAKKKAQKSKLKIYELII